MLDYGKSRIVLLIGTAASVIAGVLLANQFSSPYPYVFGLLSELLVLALSLRLYVYEINARLLERLKDRDLFVAARDFAADARDPGFADKCKSIRDELEKLASGHYELPGLAAVYEDDIKSIKSLRRGDQLCSMCPVGGTPQDVVRQFSNKSLLASMYEHFSAVRRKVRVERIYVFETAELPLVPECKAHLDEAVKKGIFVRLIFLDDPRFEDAHELPRDFIVFANNKVSVGRVGPNSRVAGADVWADRNKIDEYRQLYDQLRRQSDEYKAN